MRYEIGKPTELSGDELDHLTEVSGTVELILDVRDEIGLRQYGYPNIKNILRVAVLSSDLKKAKRTSHQAEIMETKSLFPATNVIMEWQDILPDDLHLLINGKSKICEMRSKLSSAMPKKERKKENELNNWIIDTYTSQDESYARLHNKLPTPVPQGFRMNDAPTS